MPSFRPRSSLIRPRWFILPALLPALLAIGAATVRAADQPSPVLVVPPTGPDREAKQPRAAVDPEGRVFITFGAGNTVRCVSSNDSGRTFGAPVTVGSPGVLALGMRRGPRIAATEDEVVITAIGGAIGQGQDGDIHAWRSTDRGQTWSAPVRVNDVAGSAREGLHAMAAGPEGQLFCAWVDLRDDRAEVWGASSTDGGASWSADRLIRRSPEGGICPCCSPSAAFSPDGTLWVMWRDEMNGFRDMYIARSDDGGHTFQPASKLGVRTWKFEACPMDGGAIAAGANAVSTVWMREGRSFVAAPGEPERPLGQGVQPGAAWGPGGPYYAWLAQRPGPLLALLPGMAEPIILARSANDPVVAAPLGDRGPVIAVWEAGRGGSGLFSARLDSSEAKHE